MVFPTDTLYALGADGFNEEAVGRVYEVKHRPRTMALPLLLAEVADITKVAGDIPQVAWDLAERFWPGALTLVVNRGPAVSSVVTAGQDTVAVRVPNHPLALRLIEAVGVPLTGTSANRTGEKEPVTADEVRRQFRGEIGMIVDGGPCPLEGASTIVDVTSERPRIVRQGVLAAELLAEVCPGIAVGG